VCCREESKRSVDRLILLPAFLLFTVQNFVILPAAKSETHNFDATFFVAVVALWLLWLGHVVQVLPIKFLGPEAGNYTNIVFMNPVMA
jgi:hypothetical protein